jgi:CBS domain containing-hemolysin-like protein
MAMEGLNTGTLAKEETEMIKNLMDFEQMTVRDIMTPRSVAFMLDANTTVEDYIRFTPTKVFSRIPVYKDDRDNITGIVLKDDILATMAEQRGETKIEDIKLEVNIIRDDMPLPELFRSLSKSKQHLSVVKDEFGTMVGLVTLEDVFEALLGHEIVDESDKVADLQAYARKKFEQEP